MLRYLFKDQGTRRLWHWTGWDPMELVRVDLSTDTFYEVWEALTHGVNSEV